MKLFRLDLFEERCGDCNKRLTIDDVQHMQPLERIPNCQACSIRNDKKQNREDAEEQNMADRTDSTNANLASVSQQMPDRGYDQDRGTPGWLMGEPSPGRSF